MTEVTTHVSDSPRHVSVNDAIQVLKADLQQAAARRKSGEFAPMFKITRATVELKVEFERSIGVDGKLRAVLVDIGSKGAETSRHSHTLTIDLERLDRDDEYDPSDPFVQGEDSA